jgi:hypothetical protein
MGLFSNIMSSFGEEDLLKKQLDKTSDAAGQLNLQEKIKARQSMSAMDKIGEGAQKHMQNKMANLGFGQGGDWSFQTMYDARANRDEKKPSYVGLDTLQTMRNQSLTGGALGQMSPLEQMRMQSPTGGAFGQVSPLEQMRNQSLTGGALGQASPAMQQIMQAKQQNMMFGAPQQYQAFGLLSGPSLPTTGALNVPQDYQSKLRQFAQMYGGR